LRGFIFSRQDAKTQRKTEHPTLNVELSTLNYAGDGQALKLTDFSKTIRLRFLLRKNYGGQESYEWTRWNAPGFAAENIGVVQ